MLTYGFYDSLNHDRLYNAKQMSSIFDGIIRDGVYMSIGDRFRVVARGADMTVTVGTGRAWFNHTWTLNDALIPFTLDPAEVVYNRIDAIVLEVNSNISVRSNSIFVIKGTPATNPTIPTLTNTATVHQYLLAYVRVNKRVTSIRQADVTNWVGRSSTPYVTGVIQTMNIDSLIAQWQDQWKRFFENANAEWDKFYNEQILDITNTSQYWKEQWEEFYTEQTVEIKDTNQFWKNEWQKFYVAQTRAIQKSYVEWENEWDRWYSSQTTEMQEANKYWKELWQAWFYDYVNNSTKELAYWKSLIHEDYESYSTLWKNEWEKFYSAQTKEIQLSFKNWNDAWEKFYNTQTKDMTNTNAHWKNMWESWFYDYVNNSTRELTYWKYLIHEDYESYSTLWKNEWEKFYSAQTSAIQQSYINWEKQWDDWFASQTTEMIETNIYWKELWQNWFYDYTNSSTTEFTTWRTNIDTEFKAWWDGLKDLLTGNPDANFATELLGLKERIVVLEQRFEDLATDHAIYGFERDESGNIITDEHGNPVRVKRVVFMVEPDVPLPESLKILNDRLVILEEAKKTFENDQTLYNTIDDGGSYLLDIYEDENKVGELLDSLGNEIEGRLVFMLR